MPPEPVAEIELADQSRKEASPPHEDSTDGSAGQEEPWTTLKVSKIRGVTVIVTLAGVSFLNTMGSGILIAALPQIARDLGLAEELILWPAAVYALAAGCLLLIFGTAADVVGAKLMWVTGSYLFAIFTVAVGFSRTGLQIILFRTFLGVAIAMCLPTAVGLITATFPRGPWRNTAFAMNGMGQPLGYALGLVLGGIFTDGIGWRWAYYIMAIINVVLSTASLWSLPAARRRSDKKWTRRLVDEIDWVGAVIMSAGLGLLLYVLAMVSSSYMSIRQPASASLLAVSLVLLVVFPFWMDWQTKRGRPALIPNKLWRNSAFTSICISVFFCWAALNGIEYYITLYFQNVEGLSALQSSIRFIPHPIVGTITNIATAYLVSRVRVQTLAVVSALITVTAPILMATIRVGENYWFAPFWALILSPINPDVLFTVSNIVISEAFPEGVQSLAGGVFNEVSQFGNSVGLAITAAVAASVTAHKPSTDDRAYALMEGYRAALWTVFAATAVVLLVTSVGLRKAECPPPSNPPLDKPRHLRYWHRCARTLLPHHYTPNDSQRLTLGFFIIAALDLLSPPSSATTNNKPPGPLLTPSDRRALRAWVIACQHPNGGFCGSPTHVFAHGAHDTTTDGNANIAATYFALLLLPMLSEPEHAAGGAYAGVDRAKTLKWLRRLQRVPAGGGDGSFGEVVYEVPCFGGGQQQEGERKRKYIVGGGRDMRYCYLAAAIRWILRGDLTEDEEDDAAYVEDIDVAALVRHIRRSQSYDGGFSESLGHESHAGYAYCAVAALALLDRPNTPTSSNDAGQEQTQHYTQSKTLQDGIADIRGFISFLASRQFTYLEAAAGRGQNAEEEEDEEDPDTANFHMADLSLSLSDSPDDDNNVTTKHIGFNGRCNKTADTCYTWWVLGSLSILGVLDQQQAAPPSPPPPTDPSTTPPLTIVDPESLTAARTFLLEKTQHAIGGFGKRASDPPDIYHSSLGLFALATMGDPSLKRVDAALAVSVDTVRKIEAGRRGLLRRARGGGDGDDGAGFGTALVDMGVSMGGGGGGGGGERPAWLDVGG